MMRHRKLKEKTEIEVELPSYHVVEKAILARKTFRSVLCFFILAYIFLIYIFLRKVSDISLKHMCLQNQDDKFSKYQGAEHEVTIVTAFYTIPSKHTTQEYKTWMKNLLLIRNNMVIFTDSKNHEFIQKLRSRYNGSNNIYTKIIVEDLSKSKIGSFRNKAFWSSQIKLDLEIDAHHSYQLYWIWNEKTNWLYRVSKINPFNSTFFAWIDIGYIRNEVVHGESLIRCLPHDFHPNQVMLLKIDDVVDPNLQGYNIASATLGGGFIGGYSAGIERWHRIYYKTFEEFVQKNEFVGKDQVLMNSICMNYMDLCYIIPAGCCYGDPWFFIVPFLHGKTKLCLNRKSNIHNIPTKHDIVKNKNFDKNEKIIIDVCIPAIKENLFYDLPNLLNSIKIQTLQPRSIHIYLSDVSDMTCRDSQKKLQQIVNVPLNIYCANKKRRQGIARNMLARMVHKTYAKQHVLTFIDADDKMHKRRIEIISYIFETYNPKMMLHSYFDMYSGKNLINIPKSHDKLSLMHGKDMYKIAKMSEKTKDHLWILPEIQHAHISIQKNVFQSVQYKTSSKYYRIEDAKFVRDVFNFYGKKEDTIVFVQANLSFHTPRKFIPLFIRDPMQYYNYMFNGETF